MMTMLEYADKNIKNFSIVCQQKVNNVTTNSNILIFDQFLEKIPIYELKNMDSFQDKSVSKSMMSLNSSYLQKMKDHLLFNLNTKKKFFERSDLNLVTLQKIAKKTFYNLADKMGKRISKFLLEKEKCSEMTCDSMIECQSNTFDDLKILNYTIKSENDHFLRIAFKNFSKFLRKELFFGKIWRSNDFDIQINSTYVESATSRVKNTKKWKWVLGKNLIEGMKPILSMKFRENFGLNERLKNILPTESLDFDFNLLFNERVVRISEGYKADSIFPLKKNSSLQEFACGQLRGVKISSGKIILCPSKLIFTKRDKQFKKNLAICNDTFEVTKTLIKVIKFSVITKISLRKFLHLNQGVEITTNKLYKYSFVFLNEISLKKFQTYLKENIKDQKVFAPQYIEKTQINDDWVRWNISNYDYLFMVNEFASRSLEDISQYPVFPWIYFENDSQKIELNKLENFRNFQSPMGAQGNQGRLDHYIENYKELTKDKTNSFIPYHYGSHYSSPAVVMQFFLRLSPFTKGNIELAGGKFDISDRCFFSIKKSLSSALNTVSICQKICNYFFNQSIFYTNFYFQIYMIMKKYEI